MKLWSKLKALFRKGKLEAEMAEEMRLHLEMQEEANRAAGMSPDEARYAARRQFGHMDSAKETIRDQRGWVWLEHLWQDIGYGLRMLRKNPGYTTVALLTLGLGIGANTAIFSLVNGVMLKPLPYANADRIVRISAVSPDGIDFGTSAPDYLDWEKQNTVFDRFACSSFYTATLTGIEEPRQLWVGMVSLQYFDIYNSGMALGRTFAPGEDQPGNDQVVIITSALWKSLLGADPKVIGRSITLDDKPHTVIGVLPRGEWDRSEAQVWRPLVFTPEKQTCDFHWLSVDARLRTGVSLKQAQAQMDTISVRLAHDYPDSNKGWGIKVELFADFILGPRLRQSLYLLLAAVGMILLIACANIANLTLARGMVREREVAIRASLGAGRWRLVRQFLTESLLLSTGGSMFGLGVGWISLSGLKMIIPPRMLPDEANITMDGQVLLFTVALAVLTGVICGLVPALQATRSELMASIKQAGFGTSAGRRRQRMRNTLVSIEVMLAFLLLTSAGLFLRSFSQLQKVDMRVDPTNVITAELIIPGKRFSEPEPLVAYLRQITDRLSLLPGVRDVALASALPMQGEQYMAHTRFQMAGQPPVDSANRPLCLFKTVTPSYFPVLSIKLIEGRKLNDRDVNGAPSVAVINATMAKKYFPNEDPLGKRILFNKFRFGNPQLSPEVSWEVVGVIADEKIGHPDDTNEYPCIYVTTEQSPQPYEQLLLIRSAMDPALLQPAIRNAVHEINPDQVVTKIMPLEQIKMASMGDRRFHLVLLGIFASVALALAAVGIYGVVSYSVTQRTREIGIRAALGANSRNILALILCSGMTPVVFGLGIGLVGVFGLTRLLLSFLFGVSEHDPITIAAVALILAVVALIACCIPARRATRVNPVVALRTE